MRFKYRDLEKAKAFFKENGFAVFEDVLTDEEFTQKVIEQGKRITKATSWENAANLYNRLYFRE